MLWEAETKAKEKPKAKPKAKSKPKAKKEPAKKAGHTKASLSKMTKAQLDELGKKEFNIDLDRRIAKAVLVKTLLDAQKRKWGNNQCQKNFGKQAEQLNI